MRKQRRSGRFLFLRRGEERDKERSSAKREVAPWNRGWGGVVPGGEGGLIFNKQGAIFPPGESYYFFIFAIECNLHARKEKGD